MISTLTDTKDEFIYEVRVPMKQFISFDNGAYKYTSHISISDVHVWTCDTFGLPGHRYQYHPSPGFDIVYRFKEEGDAAWFKLRWS